MDATLPPP